MAHTAQIPEPAGPVVLLARLCGENEMGEYPSRRDACKALADRGISHLSRAVYAVRYPDGSEYYPDDLVEWLQDCDYRAAYDPMRAVWG